MADEDKSKYHGDKEVRMPLSIERVTYDIENGYKCLPWPCGPGLQPPPYHGNLLKEVKGRESDLKKTQE